MMTTHLNEPVVFGNRFDNGQFSHQDGENRSQQPDLPLEVPPSPTLTNPDMILPYEGERESSTPSPPFRLPSLADLQLPPGARPLSGNFRSGMDDGGDMDNSYLGMAVSIPNRPPRSKWTYEGHAPSRPLSDIGEEDAQSQSSPPRSRGSHWDPRGEYGQGGDGEDSETCSSGSSSTISAKTEQARYKSNEDPDSVEAMRARTTAALISGAPGDDDSSSAILSSEAERILENAKRRLTLMEGNLSRARSSVRLTPSPSPSGSGGLLPLRTSQAAGELYRSISQTDRRSSIIRPRQFYIVTQDAGNNYHSRVQSETNLPSTLSSGPQASLQPSRSMSALGSTSASSYEVDDGSFPYNSSRIQPNSRPSSAFYHPTLDSLTEDNGQKANPEGPSSKTPSRVDISASNEVPKISTIEEFNSVYPSEGPPSRAQSQLQVRDLRDQAEGLKTKISMLKIKTQEDNLRRRSLQSLRTASPFTAAEQWYTSAMEYRDGNSHLNSNAGYGWSPKLADEEREEISQTHEQEHAADLPADALPSGESQTPEIGELGDDNGDWSSVIESHYEDAEDGGYDMDGSSGSEIDRDALNEILNEPLDDDDDDDEVYEDFPDMTPPEATPHEEREDAFDYEHFYLHSALGTYTQSRMRRASYSSTGSVETTRPFHDSSADNSRPGHSRSNSADSISTTVTFATATEGAYGSDDEQNEDEIDLALNWPQVPRNGVPSQQRNHRASGRDRLSQVKNLTLSPLNTGGILTPPGSGVRETSGSVTPVSAFLSAISPSASAYANPRPSSVLSNDDTRLLEQVFESLGKVCSDLQELTAPDVDADPKVVRTLRRRLDAARRVLEGQLDP